MVVLLGVEVGMNRQVVKNFAALGLEALLIAVLQLWEVLQALTVVVEEC